MPRPRVRDAALSHRFVEEAVAIVRADGVGSLTTRRVADAAGSNIAALNQLFGSRDGLIDAVMAAGFDLLVATARQRLRSVGGELRLREFAGAFREFAGDCPTIVDLMFARELSAAGAVDLAGALELRDLLTEAAREIVPDAGPDQADAVALGFGALVEGLARNERNGLLGGGAAADRVWAIAVEAMLTGLSTRGRPAE